MDIEIHDAMVSKIKKGVVLYAIFDCCHSGQVLDLKFVYDESARDKRL